MRLDQHKQKQSRNWKRKHGISTVVSQHSVDIMVDAQPEYTETLDSTHDFTMSELQSLLEHTTIDDPGFQFRNEKAAQLHVSLFQLDLDRLADQLATMDHRFYMDSGEVFEFGDVPFGWTSDTVSPLCGFPQQPLPPPNTVTKISILPSTSTTTTTSAVISATSAGSAGTAKENINEWLDDLIG
jgi:hypothetical protein